MDSRTLDQLDAWRRKRNVSNTRGISTIRRVETKWIQIQHRTFSRWVAQHTGTDIENFKVDFIDGVVFLNLMEVLSGKTVKRFHRYPQSITQRCDNVQLALDICASEDVRLTNIGAQDIANGSLKLILGLVWCLIQRYHLTTIYERRTSSLGTRDPVKDNNHKTQLLRGLNKTLDKVKLRVNNIKDDWRDGMALTALVTYLAPAYNKDFMGIERSEYISATDAAMAAAEKYLSIPRLLSADDFTSDDVDELSMITYLSYFMDPSHKKVRENYLREHPEYIPLYKPFIEPPEQTNHTDSINNSNNSSLLNSPEAKEKSFITSPDSKNNSLINNSNSKNSLLSKNNGSSNSSESRSSSPDGKKSPIKKLLSSYKDRLKKSRVAENKYKEPYQITEVDREIEREAELETARETECDGAVSPDFHDETPLRSMSEGEPYRTKSAYSPDGSVVSQAETSASSSTASGVTIRHHKAIRRPSKSKSPNGNKCDSCRCPKPCECPPRRASMPTDSAKRETATSPQALTRDSVSRESFKSTCDSDRSEQNNAPMKPPKPESLARSLSFTHEREPSPEYENLPPVEGPKVKDDDEEVVSDSERDEILEQIFNAASVEDLTKADDEYDENMPPLQRFQRSNTTVGRNKSNKSQAPSAQILTGNAAELTPFFRDHEILAEYKLLCNNVSSGVYVIPSPQSIQVWNGVIFIKIGMFADGCFKFNLHIPDDFPYSRPSLQFITPVFHPQVNGSGELNLSKAFPTWTPRKDRVWHLLRYTKRCFFSVNTFDATNPTAASAVQESIDTFRHQARLCVDESIRFNYNEECRTNEEDNIFGGKLLNDTQLQIVRDKVYKGNLDYSLIFQ